MDLLSYESDEEEVDDNLPTVDLNVIDKETATTVITNIPENMDDDQNIDEILQVDQCIDDLNPAISYDSSNIARVKQLQHPLLDTMLPPLTEMNVNPLTIQNIKDYKERGLDLTETLRSNKQFGNPYILTKVVNTLGIDEVFICRLTSSFISTS